MKRIEVEEKYNPRTIVNLLERKGKSLFSIFDLKEQFRDSSVAAWVLHDLTVLGVLESRNGDIVYVNNIPFQGFRFRAKRLPNYLPGGRRATFVRWCC
jgi:hypothetical protein